MKVARYSVMVLFGFLLFAKGILPAFSSVGTDFANYYTSSFIIAREPSSIPKMYDAAWFSQRARDLGSPEGGIFQPFPPTTALLLLPLVTVDMMSAKRIWTVVNLGILLALVVVLSRIGRIDVGFSLFLVLVQGFAIINNFYLGQVYLLMTLCLALSVYFVQRGRDVAGGVLAGLFLPVKYFPIVLVLYFLLQRRWKAAASAVATALVVTGASILLSGWQIHLSFLQSILLPHLDGQMADPFSSTYQSWDSLLRSLFIADPVRNALPLFHWAEGFQFFRATIVVLLLLLLVRLLWRGYGRQSTDSFRIAGLFAFGLLVAPATASYHFLLLALPMALVSGKFLRENRYRELVLVLTFYAGASAIPVGILGQISPQGVWKLFAYPRLYLLLGFFLASYFLGLRTSDEARIQMPEVVPQ